MLQVTPQHRLLLATGPTDFRKGLDSLKAVCKQQLLADPFSGAVFVFANRALTSVKILAYDGNGFWLCQKRFSEGKLKWWPNSGSVTCAIPAHELQVLLAQGNPKLTDAPEAWRALD